MSFASSSGKSFVSSNQGDGSNDTDVVRTFDDGVGVTENFVVEDRFTTISDIDSGIIYDVEPASLGSGVDDLVF